MKTQQESERQSELEAKKSKHEADASSPALTPEEVKELATLQAK